MADPKSRPILVVGIGSPHVVRFVGGLLEAGQTVVLITDRPQPFLEIWPDLPVEAMDLSTRAWRTPGLIRAMIRRWRPWLIHSHQADSVSWHTVRAARGSRVPVVVTIWGSDVLATPQRSPLHRWMVRSTLLAAAGWTGDARILLDSAGLLVGRRAKTKPQALILLGIDRLQGAHPQSKDRRILSCRLHRPLYRIDRIIQAFASLPDEQSDWVLEIAGDGDETPGLMKLARELGVADRVEFVGFLDQAQLQESYRRSAVFVSFPLSDGTSVSLLEAMASGCLPVLSNLPANREWIVDALNGLLVDATSDLPTALAEAISWSQSSQWFDVVAPQNRSLIERKGLLRDNVRQFLDFARSVAKAS
jgi:glycosyltransferase involved in cell wall biosynthesis